jgi:two-component system response regulator HydG
MVAASSRDLAGLMEAGRFRKDLFYKLNVVNLRVPALRERTEDIPVLVAQVLAQMRRDTGVAYSLSDESLGLLMTYEWPGNLRELESLLERACALSSGPVLHLEDLPTQLQNFARDDKAKRDAEDQERLQDNATPLLTLEELEKQAILSALRHLKGDKMQAAKLLGIGKTTLYRKLKEYGIADDVH